MADDTKTTCWISFGGNVGDVRATFDAALALLSLHNQIELCRRSGIYGSSPMGSNAGCRFLNSICELKTELSACELLAVLQSVETQLGRVRTICWGPRTLDLDLLSYGASRFDEPQLIVPHPALTYRRFVLDPLVEVDPNWCHPACARTAAQLHKRLKQRPLKIELLDIPKPQQDELSSQIQSKFPDVQLVSNDNSIGRAADVNPLIPQVQGTVPDDDISEGVISMVLTSSPSNCQGSIVDLRRSPGEALEKLTSALTAIFDSPLRVSDW